MHRETLLIVSMLLMIGAATAYGVDKKTFAKTASQSGHFEMMSGELAQEKSKSAGVKDFAKMMVEDHGGAVHKLDKIAEEAGVKSVESGVGQKTKYAAHMKMLQDAAPGVPFDEVYINIQRKTHQEAVALFREYAENGDDPKLKQFAAETLPTLQAHVDHAMKLSPGS